jgi:hypothetical protein
MSESNNDVKVKALRKQLGIEILRIYKFVDNEEASKKLNSVLANLEDEYLNEEDKIEDQKPAQPIAEELIYFTDSEDEDSNEDSNASNKENSNLHTKEMVSNLAPAVAIQIDLPPSKAPVKSCLSTIDKTKLKQEFDRRRRELLTNKQNALYHRLPLSDRSNLLIALNQRVRERALENHCIIEKVKEDQFHFRIELTNRCR